MPRLVLSFFLFERGKKKEEERERGHGQRRKIVSFFLIFSLSLSLSPPPVHSTPAHQTHRMSALIPALTALSLAAAASSHRVCSAASFPSS